MSITQLTCVVATVSLLAACGGPARPRLTEITQTHQSASGLSIDHRQLSYETDGRLRGITRSVDSILLESWRFEYDGRRIRSASASELDSGVLHRLRFQYADDAPVRIGHTLRDSGSDTAETPVHWDAEPSLAGLRFDSHGRLVAIDETDGAATARVRFTYDAEDRIEGIEEPYGTLHRVHYGDSGIVDRIEAKLPGGGTRTTRYLYDDGTVVGIVPTPDFPCGEHFDLEGRRLEPWRALTSAMLAL